MRTFAEIYDIALKAGIVDEYKRYNSLLAEALKEGKDTNAINYNFNEQQVKVLISLQYEITGIRPGSCNGCVQDVLRNMNRWLHKFEGENVKVNTKSKESKHGIKRKA